MTYTLSPDIPDTNFLVRDIENNDPPRIKPTHTYEPSSQYDVCIGIIGGADGPTALIPIPGIRHAAISALHFEPRDKIEWQIMFREKLIDDTEIELIQNTEEI